MTVSPREPLPTVFGRQSLAVIEVAARAAIAGKGILVTTISDVRDFADYRSDICAAPIDLVTLMVETAQRQGFCDGGDGACVDTLAAVFYRTIDHRVAA